MLIVVTCYKTTGKVQGNNIVDGNSTLQMKLHGSDKSVSKLVNKHPVLGPDNIYRLNFNGRVTKSSVKNVQLVYEHQDRVLLQFGK